MPYWRLFYHLIWATKSRLPLLQPDVWPELERLLVLNAHKNLLVVHGVGGVADHLHMAVSIPPAMSVASAVGKLKGSSSYMLNQTLGNEFGWQPEYGVVSFAERNLPQVLAYIADQPRHHTENRLWQALEQLPESTNRTTADQKIPAPFTGLSDSARSVYGRAAVGRNYVDEPDDAHRPNDHQRC